MRTPAEFKRLADEFVTLPLNEQLAAFTPFEIGRGLRRDCEINYYIDIGLQLHLKNAQIPQEQKAFFWQNISFAHLQKGLHNEARGYWAIAEGYKKNILPENLALFDARQAQIRGPLYRELDGDPDAGITVLTNGLALCEKINDADLRYLAELANSDTKCNLIVQ